MFGRTNKFSQNLDKGRSKNVASIDYMFLFSSAFNGLIKSWDTSIVESMKRVFERSQVFN